MTAELVTAADTSMLPDAARIPSGAKPALMYLGELHTEYSKRTMRSALNLFARWGGAESLLDVEWAKLTPVAVSSFMRQQLSAGKSAVSVNLYLCALKGVAKAAWQLELLNHDALDRIRSIKQVRVSRLPVGRSLTYSESAALLSAAAGDDPQKIRDRAILTLFLGCGLRRAEICSLQMDKVDLFDGTIRLIGKGNKERKAFLTPDMRKTVAAWLDVRSAGLPFRELHRVATTSSRSSVEPVFTLSDSEKVLRRRGRGPGDAARLAPHLRDATHRQERGPRDREESHGTRQHHDDVTLRPARRGHHAARGWDGANLSSSIFFLSLPFRVTSFLAKRSSRIRKGRRRNLVPAPPLLQVLQLQS